MTYKKYDCLRFSFRNFLGLFDRKELDMNYCYWLYNSRSLNNLTHAHTQLRDKFLVKMELPGEFFT